MYTHERKVTYSEISMNGYADIAQIAEYLQDCSVSQSDEVGVSLDYLAEHHLAWLLASWQIVVERYPGCGEKLRVSTWPYTFDSAFGYRNFALEDETGRRLAVANSQWLLLNTETGHPTKIDEKIAHFYTLEERAAMDYAPRKIAFREPQQVMEPVRVPRAFIDTNHHMNNAQYIRTALEYLPGDFHIGQVRVEFKRAAVLGDLLYPYVYCDSQTAKVLLADEKKNAFAVIEFKSA